VITGTTVRRIFLCGDLVWYPPESATIRYGATNQISHGGCVYFCRHGCRACHAAGGSNARAQELIRTLKLHVLPRNPDILGLSAIRAAGNGGWPNAGRSSQNYYMLTRDLPVNYLHWLAPDDYSYPDEGGPVDYFIFHPTGARRKLPLAWILPPGRGRWWRCRVVAGRRCGSVTARITR